MRGRNIVKPLVVNVPGRGTSKNKGKKVGVCLILRFIVYIFKSKKKQKQNQIETLFLKR